MLMNASNLPSNFEVVKFLVESGANLNLRNRDGKTAIGAAMRMKQQIQGSIDATGNPNFSRFFGDPEVARVSYVDTQKEYEKLIEYLRKHGGTE